MCLYKKLHLAMVCDAVHIHCCNHLFHLLIAELAVFGAVFTECLHAFIKKVGNVQCKETLKSRTKVTVSVHIVHPLIFPGFSFFTRNLYKYYIPEAESVL